MNFKRNAIFSDIDLSLEDGRRGKIYSGLCIIQSKALIDFEWDNCSDFETYFFNRCIDMGAVGAFQVDGLWFPIDTPKQLEALNCQNDFNGNLSAAFSDGK